MPLPLSLPYSSLLRSIVQVERITYNALPATLTGGLVLVLFSLGSEHRLTRYMIEQICGQDNIFSNRTRLRPRT